MEKLLDIESVLAEPQPDDHLESVIADAMNQLSFQEREKIVHEVHGVFDGFEETPDFLAKRLNAMDDELVKLKTSPGRMPTAAFELAESLSLEFVEDPEFRLCFLRCEDFKPELAAERMVHYFDFKFAMFGGEKLCKTITYDDLDQDDIDALEKGFMQWLPERDRAGRPVVIFFPSEQTYNKGADRARVFGRLNLYMRSLLENDEIAAKKGFVMIAYNVGQFNVERLYSEIPPVLYKATKAMPTKIVSLHLCFSSMLFRIIAQNVLKLFREEIRAGGKIHQGSQQEVKYLLMTYGIPAHLLPVDAEDRIKRNNWLDLLDMNRKRQEYVKNERDPECCIIPNANDVLYGKGCRIQERAANVKLQMTVEELVPLYDTLDRAGKSELQTQVIETVKEAGGHFLSRDSGVWMEVPDTLAQGKVAMMFRNRRKVLLQKSLKKAAASKQSRDEVLCEAVASSSGSGKRLRS